MAVSSGNTIQAADYNSLQSRINTILGNGSASDGYGQALASAQISVGNDVTAAQMDNIRTDINKANAHQTGSNTTLGNIAVGDIIGADASGLDIDNLTENDKGFNDFLDAMTTVETNRFVIDATQASVEAAITSTRTTAWNGVLTHEFTVSFADADTRRHFFNAGGEIRFSANLSGGSGAKDTDWATMLSNMGTIKFNYLETTATGTGTPEAIGNYDLTSTYQKIFQKDGSGVYAENDYNISAKEDSTSVIRFQVEFRDDDAGDQTGSGPPQDENVGGTLTSTIQQFRPTGSNVSVASPSYANTTTL